MLAHALIVDFEGARTDAVWTPFVSEFGLEPESTISMDIVSQFPANDTYVLILTHAQWMDWNRLNWIQLQNELQPDSPHIPSVSSYLASYWRRHVALGELHAKLSVQAQSKDRYHVGIYNAHRRELLLTGTVSLVNPDGQQLSVEERQVPSAAFVMAILFVVGGLLFLGVVLSAPRRSRSLLHLLMAGVIWTKACVLFLYWAELEHVAEDGRDPFLGSAAWELANVVQTILELMLFLCVALGWKLLRLHISLAERRFAAGTCAFSFVLGACEVLATSGAYSTLELSRYILHSLCYLVIIVAMNFNLQLLQAQVAEGPASLEVAILYQKMHSYRIFRWVFLVFIIAPTVELFIKVSVIPWDTLWVFVFIEEVRTLVIYGIVCWCFRPAPMPLRALVLMTRDAATSSSGTTEGTGSSTRGSSEAGEEMAAVDGG